jgi:hypothetical protein
MAHGHGATRSNRNGPVWLLAHLATGLDYLRVMVRVANPNWPLFISPPFRWSLAASSPLSCSAMCHTPLVKSAVRIRWPCGDSLPHLSSPFPPIRHSRSSRRAPLHSVGYRSGWWRWGTWSDEGLGLQWGSWDHDAVIWCRTCRLLVAAVAAQCTRPPRAFHIRISSVICR